RALADTIRRVSSQIFIPLAVGGGIGGLDDAKAVIDAGADKVSINSAPLRDPSVITSLANVYGSQAVVVAIDAQRSASGYSVYGRSGTALDERDAVEWAKEAESRGAGE